MNHANNQTVVRSFIGKQADDLGNLISEQIKPIYQSLGIFVPVKSCSIIHQLYVTKLATVTELAKALKQSHQLVKQKLPRLLKLELIESSNDPEDKRRVLYRLTQLGIDQAERLNQHSMAQVYANLCEEINADLYQVLTAAINGLKQKDLFSRFKEHDDVLERKNVQAHNAVKQPTNTKRKKS